MSGRADGERATTRDLAGAVVLVTGGAGGLGLALAKEAVRRGAQIMLADTADASGVAAELRDQGATVEWMRADMRNYGEVETLVARIVERFGGLNVLCNNAGTGAAGGLAEVEPEAAKAVLDVNVLGYFYGIHAAAPALKAAAAAGRPAGRPTSSTLDRNIRWASRHM